jgi:hypothetical protein
MTVRTFIGKSFLMKIFMAGQAFGTQSKVGFKFLVFYFLICYELRFMAIQASFLAMRAKKLIPGQVMIEIILVKTDDFKCSAMVVIMADYAGFAGYVGRRMVSLLFIHPVFDFCMAGKAFIVGYLIS